MHLHQHDCAVAQGPVTPTSDEAPAGSTAQGFRDQERADSPDCADTTAHRKAAAMLTARAELLGLVAEPLPGGLWRVVAGTGSTMHPSQQSVLALVAGIEQVRAEVGALVRSGRSDMTAAERNPWLNLQARFLLAKFSASLLEGDDGKPLLVILRWAFCKSFTATADAEAWLKRVGGPNA